jgi:hypothetical protein
MSTRFVRAHPRRGTRGVRRHVRRLPTPQWVIPPNYNPQDSFDETEKPPREAIEIVWVPTEGILEPSELASMRFDSSYGEKAEVIRRLRARLRARQPIDPSAAVLKMPDGKEELSVGWHRIYAAAMEGLPSVPIAVAVADDRGPIHNPDNPTNPNDNYARPPFDVRKFKWWRNR